MTEAETQPQHFRMPAEWEPHAAVWLQWPAENMRPQPGYHVKLESTWLAMTRAMRPHVEVCVVVPFQRACGSITDAAYTNYLVTNGVVLLPVYDRKEDERGRAIVAEHFPGREVVGIPTLTLTEEGGAVHCVTQQQPAAGPS